MKVKFSSLVIVFVLLVISNPTQIAAVTDSQEVNVVLTQTDPVVFYAFTEAIGICSNGALIEEGLGIRAYLTIGYDWHIFAQITLTDGTLAPPTDFTQPITATLEIDLPALLHPFPVDNIRQDYLLYEILQNGQLISSSSIRLECPIGYTGPVTGTVLYSGPPIPSSPSDEGNPVIENELEHGIIRVFDDGIVVARQPNGDYHFYLYDGCEIGSVSRQFLDSANANSNRTLTSVEGCGGYLINIDATGYSACSIVLNMYGPSGYNKTHWLTEDFDSTLACATQLDAPDLFARCEERGRDGCVTGVVPSQANVIFVNGIQNSLNAHLEALSLLGQTNESNIMGIYNQGLLSNWGSVEHAASTQALTLYLALTDHPITLVGHSQGGAIIAEALRPLEGNPRLNNVKVYTFGSPAESYPSGPIYRHCTFEEDPVTLPPISRMREVVTPLKIIPVDLGGFVDHSFADYVAYYSYCTN